MERRIANTEWRIEKEEFLILNSAFGIRYSRGGAS